LVRPRSRFPDERYPLYLRSGISQQFEPLPSQRGLIQKEARDITAWLTERGCEPSTHRIGLKIDGNDRRGLGRLARRSYRRRPDRNEHGNFEANKLGHERWQSPRVAFGPAQKYSLALDVAKAFPNRSHARQAYGWRADTIAQ